MKIIANSTDNYLAILRRALTREGLSDWTAAVNDDKIALGKCDFIANTIYLSSYWLQQLPRLEVIDTILHEVAHAIAGFTAAHGPQWQEQVARLGAQPAATAKIYDYLQAGFGSYLLVNMRDSEILRMWMYEPPARWQSGERTKLYPPGHSDLQGHIVFWKLSDMPQAIIAKLKDKNAITSYPFLRRFITRQGQVRLYLNGIGALWDGTYLRASPAGMVELVISKGVVSDEQQEHIVNALDFALQAVGCRMSDKFSKVYSQVLLG